MSRSEEATNRHLINDSETLQEMAGENLSKETTVDVINIGQINSKLRWLPIVSQKLLTSCFRCTIHDQIL